MSMLVPQDWTISSDGQASVAFPKPAILDFAVKEI
jgi:hypothetical protein